MKLVKVGISRGDFIAHIALEETELLDIKADYEKLSERSESFKEISRYVAIADKLQAIYMEATPLWDKIVKGEDDE